MGNIVLLYHNFTLVLTVYVRSRFWHTPYVAQRIVNAMNMESVNYVAYVSLFITEVWFLVCHVFARGPLLGLLL